MDNVKTLETYIIIILSLTNRYCDWTSRQSPYVFVGVCAIYVMCLWHTENHVINCQFMVIGATTVNPTHRWWRENHRFRWGGNWTHLWCTWLTSYLWRINRIQFIEWRIWTRVCGGGWYSCANWWWFRVIIVTTATTTNIDTRRCRTNNIRAIIYFSCTFRNSAVADSYKIA